MPISGLVVTFDSATNDLASLIKSLGQIPEIEVGKAAEHRIAVVVDSESPERDREVWQAVQQLPGVVDISIAMVGFDGDRECPSPEGS